MDVGLIVGEATDLTWDRWRHISGLAERLGFDSLFRSDHYVNGRHKHAIDVYLSFVLTAEVTERIRFGPLVTPVTFREPVNVGRMAQQLDALSVGRFVLGLGAGWHAEEHEIYGIDFPPAPERYDRLEEAIALLGELWHRDRGTFEGRHYRLAGTDSKPHPPPGRPPILIGGTGPTRTLPIAAAHAAEWNATPLGPADYAAAAATLDRHAEAVGRDPGEIRRSMLLFAAIGPDRRHADRAAERYLAMIAPVGATMTEAEAEAAGLAPWRGSVEQLVDHCGRLGELGLQEVVFDHLCADDDAIPVWLADEVAPRLRPSEVGAAPSGRGSIAFRERVGRRPAGGPMSDVIKQRTEPVTPLGVNHLVLNVRDMEESHHFWSDLLGFEQVGQLRGSHGRPPIMNMRFYSGVEEGPNGQVNHHDLALVERAGLPEPPDQWSMVEGNSAINHIAITYPDRASWLEQVRFLKERGVPMNLRMDHGMTHSVYINDPNGYGVEVLYELPEEVWRHDIDGALNHAVALPDDQLLTDDTNYTTEFD